MARSDAQLVPASGLWTAHAIYEVGVPAVAVGAGSPGPAAWPGARWRDDRPPEIGVEEPQACGGVVPRCFATNAISIAICLMRSSTTSEPWPAS